MKRVSILILVALCIVCCKRKEIDVAGSWSRIDQEGPTRWGQGIQLNPDGTAIAVGIDNLILDSWERDGDMLMLSGKRVISRISFPFTDTLIIEKRTTQDSLFLSQGDKVQVFRRL